MRIDLTGKRVLVTGGNSGLGAAMARAFASAGAVAAPINTDVRQDPAGLKDLLTKIPLDRIGKPEDVAGMAVVLASDVAAYVTGTTIFVDGGMTDYPGFMHGG